MKRAIIFGALVGTMLTGAVTAGAMGKIPVGNLYTKNPIYSAPKGYAETIGPKGSLSAKCTVSKSGYSTKSVSATKKTSGSVETSWISGPTYSSSGTKFKSTHSGYDADGNYWTGTASKQY